MIHCWYFLMFLAVNDDVLILIVVAVVQSWQVSAEVHFLEAVPS